MGRYRGLAPAPRQSVTSAHGVRPGNGAEMILLAGATAASDRADDPAAAIAFAFEVSGVKNPAPSPQTSGS